MTIKIGNFYYGVELSRYWGWRIIKGHRGYRWIELGFLCLERMLPFSSSEWDALMHEWGTPEENEAWKDL